MNRPLYLLSHYLLSKNKKQKTKHGSNYNAATKRQRKIVMRILRRVYVPWALKSLTTFIIVVHLEVTCCFYLFYKWLRAIVFLLCAYAWFFLVSNFTSLLFNELFPPFYSSILKPDFHLSFRQSQLLGKIEPLPSDHILLACELSFQAL